MTIELLEVSDCIRILVDSLLIGIALSGIPALLGIMIQGFKRIFNISVEGG